MSKEIICLNCKKLFIADTVYLRYVSVCNPCLELIKKNYNDRYNNSWKVKIDYMDE